METSRADISSVVSDHGRRERAQDDENGRVDWLATIVKNGRLPILPEELQRKQNVRDKPLAVMIAIDCSASTLKGGALGAAKGAVHDLMLQAYKQRAKAGILIFSGQGVSVIKPIAKVARAALKPELNTITGGGGTPLLEAWRRSIKLLHDHWRRHAGDLKLFVLTDGRAAMPVSETNLETILGVRNEHAKHINSTIIDIERQPVRLAKAREFARITGSQYVCL